MSRLVTPPSTSHRNHQLTSSLAIEAGVLVWVCVWNVPEAKFTIEKSALEAALKKYPDTSKWLKGINVGSESLYRKEITASRLAEQIYGMFHHPTIPPHY